MIFRELTQKIFAYNLFTILFVFLFFSVSIAAEQEAETVVETEPIVEKFSAEELEKLVSPIALYPDDLLAQVLTASTVPLDVVKAAQYQNKNKNKTKPPQKAMEAWEPSVISLMMFPDTLAMMNDDLDWLEQLGAAVYAQEEEVYSAIQQLRRQAESAGNLESNDQQDIVKEKEFITIVPADPEIIYVPVYDPLVVYVPTTTVVTVVPPPPAVVFGVGITVGIGLSYAFDWRHHHVVHHRHWRHPSHHHNYYRKRPAPHYPGRPPGVWVPPPPRPGVHPRAPRPPVPPRPGVHPRAPRPPVPGPKPPGYKRPPVPKSPARPVPRVQTQTRRPPAGYAPTNGYSRGSTANMHSNRGRQSQASGRKMSPQSPRPRSGGARPRRK